MTRLDHFVALACYNKWMNDRIFAICGTLSDEERTRDMGAFFGSIHRTLDHLIYGDTAWMCRFENRLAEVPRPGKQMHASFGELVAARRDMDERIMRWSESLTVEWLDASFFFTSNLDGVTRTKPAWLLVAHMFNHQTHHRGQVTTLLSQLGRDPGVTDLPWMPQDDSTAEGKPR